MKFLKSLIKGKKDYISSCIKITLKKVLRYIGQFVSHFIVEKISFIPPLLHDNTLITDFKQKAYLFNNFFASQCATFANNSLFQVFSHTRLI